MRDIYCRHDDDEIPELHWRRLATSDDVMILTHEAAPVRHSGRDAARRFLMRPGWETPDIGRVDCRSPLRAALEVRHCRISSRRIASRLLWAAASSGRQMI